MADVLDDTENPVEKPEGDDEAADFSVTLKKKKKKKPVKKEEATPADAAVSAASTSTPGTQEGSAWEGSDRDYTYTELLERMFNLLRERNPDLAGARGKRHTLPPPEMVRVGTRKTMWANFEKICNQMHRQQQHVQSFVLAELGTEGAIDGNQRLVVKGRYAVKQFESLLKKYIAEYVMCHMCRTPDTTLTRDSVTRLYFLQCESCGSRRSVAPIKTGFHATSRSDRRKEKS